MSRSLILFITSCCLLLLVRTLNADDKITRGKFVVSLSGKSEQKPWVVKALEQNIYNDLSGYERVIPFNKLDNENSACENRDIDCLLDLYKEYDVDAIMIGEVGLSDIDYDVYDIQKKALVNSGSINISRNSNLLKLRMGAFVAFKSFLGKGGILDQRQFKANQAESLSVTIDSLSMEQSERRKQFLLITAIFTCLPYLLSFLGKQLKSPFRSKVIIRWFIPYLLIFLSLIGFQYFLETSNSANFMHNQLQLPPDFYWISTCAGGLAWGILLSINIKMIFPHLQGIERISQANLVPLLHAYMINFIMKLLFFLSLYSGIIYLALYTGKLFAISEYYMTTLFIPIFIIYMIYWIGLMLEVMAMRLDVSFTGKRLKSDEVLLYKIRKYFINNLKRNGTSLKKSLIDNVNFLPGEREGVFCYGGMFSNPRVVINHDLLDLSIGTTSENIEKTLHPKDKQRNAIFAFPTFIPPTKKSRISDKKRKNASESFEMETRRCMEMQSHNIRVDEDVMQGVILPILQGKDDLPSLMFDNVDDMSIVQGLLLEDTQLRTPHNETDIDDSSERDRDLLFGVVLQKFGIIMRHDHFFATITLFLRKKQKKVRRAKFILHKYFLIISDTFVAINFGLNHLLQYLYYEATKKTSHLTTKGDPNDFIASQNTILTGTATLLNQRKIKFFQTDDIDRILWLSQFCQTPLVAKKKSRIRKLSNLLFPVGLTYILAVFIYDAYIYRPIYQEIIDNEKKAITEALEEAQNEERSEK